MLSEHVNSIWHGGYGSWLACQITSPAHVIHDSKLCIMTNKTKMMWWYKAKVYKLCLLSTSQDQCKAGVANSLTNLSLVGVGRLAVAWLHGVGLLLVALWNWLICKGKTMVSCSQKYITNSYVFQNMIVMHFPALSVLFSIYCRVCLTILTNAQLLAHAYSCVWARTTGCWLPFTYWSQVSQGFSESYT